MPPIEAKASKKKVNDRNDGVYTNSVLYANNTNTDNVSDEDDNGNRASVADLCKKFDDKPLKAIKNGTTALSNKTLEGKFKKRENTELNNPVKLTNGKKVNGVKKSSSSTSASKKADSLTATKCQSNTDVLQSNSKLEVNDEGPVENGTELNRDEVTTDDLVNNTPSRSNSRVNNFASYISTKDFQKGDEKPDGNVDDPDSKENSKNDMDNKDSYVGKIIQPNVSKKITTVFHNDL